MKKPRTPAQLANDERLRNKKVLVGTPDIPAPQTTFSEEEVSDLLRRVKELEQNQFTQQAQSVQQNVSANAQGKLVGTFEKYLVDKAAYPDPSERLSHESRLSRFAFPLNYELVFDVGISSYQTFDGVNTKEPRFTLQLINIVMDDDGEPTNSRYMSYQMIFHEDPQAALVIARDNGINVDEMDEKTFLNEMRYLRMRDWLMDIFYPKKALASRGKKEMVIGNRVVEVYEVNSESTESIPFNTLSKKF